MNFKFIIEFENAPDNLPIDVARQLASQACANMAPNDPQLEDDTEYLFIFDSIEEHSIS